MAIPKWRSPVNISIGDRSSETVSGPFEAVIHLTESWPNRTSASFIEARNACRGALAGRIDAEVARSKFLAAAKDANLRVH
ncbi:hypothetical protein CHY08_23690 (plasmid) [Rhizobium leguminosarum bv. viciae]|uniref:DUF982 domain-containing protein n=1 Tax=Rhizobium leguminosarum TaxID=384 RepID=UPI000B8CC554|nr:DUF982 domain-containing protein [Rhizobium leguminosarum]ASR10655.1 hypothetical protein CHY08_23690 [Rhizobium leguminosarum bv. viciae]